MLDYTAIGKNIRAFRKARNLSQEQLAEKIWISTSHMSHIETGSTKLSLSVLVDIAHVLQVGTDEILATNQYIEKDKIPTEIHALIHSSSATQAEILLDLLKAAKHSMDKHL
jgi:transcriptional regulator with XRE-family HTH domain